MHIAIISPGFPSDGQPVYVFVQQLVFALVDAGTKVSVIAPQSLTHSLVRHEKVLPKQSKCKTASGKEFDVFRPYDLSFGRRLRRLEDACSFICNSAISKILDIIKPDVLYGHFWFSAYRVGRYAARRRIPLFVACGEGDNALEEFVEKLSEVKKKEFVGTVSGVISVSSENKRKCIQYGLISENRITVLPNCVDTTLMYPRDPDEYRRGFNLSQTDFVILFVGSFVHRKGSRRLAAAVDMLDDKDVKVFFVGSPLGGENENPECKGMVFKGKVSHEELPKYYAIADVFVLPTLKEGCCNAIVEALACGVPVISSDLPFNDDILNDGNSIRIDPNSSSSIADAIDKIKNDVGTRNTLKQNVLRDAGNYSITSRAARIVSFINRTIDCDGR